MKWKKVLKWSAAAVFTALVITVIQFFTDNIKEKERPVIQEEYLYVLAPYEVRVHRQILDEIARDYSNIAGNKTVIFEYVREEEFKKELCLRMDRGETTDLIICGNQMMPALVEMGIFKDISDYVTVEKRNTLYYQALWESTRSNGRYYGIPLTCDPYVLFYNRDDFQEKGFALPRTWEELVKTSAGVQNYGTYGFGFPGKQADESCLFFSYMLYSKGGSYRNINREAGITSFEQIRMLKDKKYISPETINWSRKDLAEVFASGQVEMIADSLSMLGVIRTSPVKFEVGITVLPGEVKGSGLLLGENIGLSAEADEEAEAFLDYLYQPDVMERITYAMDTLPILYNVPYRPKTIHADEGAAFQDIYKMSGYNLESYEAWFEISALLSGSITNVLENPTISSEETAADVHENVRMAIIEK